MAVKNVNARVFCFVVCVGGLLAAPADAGIFAGDDAFSWVTVGAPGNRDPTPQEAGHTGSPLDWNPVGAVDHAFRITQTPVTAGQFIEFVQAYKPFATTQEMAGQVGMHIDTWPAVPVVFPGSNNFPATPSLRLAKKFANWLHNGKVNEAWAFADGVYDTSTFGTITDANGNFLGYSDQVGPKAGASVWIPSEAEYVKALYYDPHRYGEGEEGYWMYPNGGNEPLIPGPPGVGQTDAGYDTMIYHPVGSYPNTQSPWGVLDVSGGERERVDSAFGFFQSAVVRGSTRGGSTSHDEISFFGTAAPVVSIHAFRLASPVPAAPSVGVFVALFFTLSRRHNVRASTR